MNLKKILRTITKIKTVIIIRKLVIYFNSIDQNINKSYQLKNKDISWNVENKKIYDLYFSISNAARAHNINIYINTKYFRDSIFNHNIEVLTEEIEKKMKASRKFRNVDLNLIKDTAKVLVSTRYVFKGNIYFTLNLEKGEKGSFLGF